MLIQGPYFDGFDAKFGWTLETSAKNMWPGSDEAEVLIANLEAICTGFTQTTKDGKTVARRIQEKIRQRLDNYTQRKRRELKSRLACKSMKKPYQVLNTGAFFLIN